MANNNESIDTITNVLLKVERLAGMLNANLGFYDETWGSLSCSEAEAFADLFHAAGWHALAESIIEEHGFHDEEGDEHFDPANAAAHKASHGR